MQAMLLSDHPPLLTGLRTTLAGLGREVTVRRTTRLLRPPLAGRARLAPSEAPPADVLFVDLAWCGLQGLAELTQGLRQWMAHTPVVLLLDSPEQVAMVHQAQVDADLLVAKSAAPSVVCRSMQRFFDPRPS